MKKIFTILLLLIASFVQATNYYVSATGNDASAGTSPGAAWKTIDKVNAMFSTILPGDFILFDRGFTYYGSLLANRSGTNGNPITIGSYGTGAKPIITGLTTLTGFSNIGGGIWEKNVPTMKNGTTLVLINGIPQQIARYPNRSDANGGYFTYNSSSATTNITDNSRAPLNKVGATIVVRPVAWAAEANRITAVSGNTTTFTFGKSINFFGVSGNTPLMFAKKNNYGYFYQNDFIFLDQFGEFFLDTVTKDFDIYLGINNPTMYIIEVATVDIGFNLNTRNYITVQDVNFKGFGTSGIFARDNQNITVKGCDFYAMGARGIQLFATANTLIENVNVNHSLSSGIQVINRNKANVTIRDCKVKNTAPYLGMDCFYDDSDGIGIYATATNNVLIERCQVDTVGKTAVNFQGSDVLCQNISINYYMFNYGDRGGFYLYSSGTDSLPGTEYTNRVIRNSFIYNGIGDSYGTSSSSQALAAIYLDGRTMNVDVTDCVMYNSNKNGTQCNNAKNINIRGCLYYQCSRSMSFVDWSWGSITNLNMKNNTVYNPQQYNVYYTNADLDGETILEALSSVLMDSNYYNKVATNQFGIESYSDVGVGLPGVNTTLAGWRSATGLDVHSLSYPDVPPLLYTNKTSDTTTVTLTKNVRRPNGTLVPAGNYSMLPYTYLFGTPEDVAPLPGLPAVILTNILPYKIP